MAVSQTYFSNARNFMVNGGQFFNINHTNNVFDSDPVSTVLWPYVTAGAMFDSAERFPPAKCHPGTRERIIAKIVDWIDNLAPNQRILWLYGPAGSGKSALAHTICERYRDSCKGSFFFARGPTDRGKALKLFPTLAYQLALQFPSMRVALNEALYLDPSLPTKSMEVQLFSLIIQPLLRCAPFREYSPILIIDGLDECGDDQGVDTQRNIIALISQSIAEHDIPLRFLIASRPESWIRDTFESSPLPSITLSLSLRDDIDADKDIRAYLTDEFEKIRVENKRIMGSVTSPWPPPHIVDRFVYEASGQYIYASTLLKFVGKSSRYSDPQEQLRILISPGPHRAVAFSELHRLYETIISAYPRWETMKRVLGGILAGANLTIIEKILGVDPIELTLVLDALSPLINVETPGQLSHYEQMLEPIYGPLKQGQEKIQLCHLSFREFLEDETLSGSFHIGIQEIINEITRGFFGVIICNIDQNYAAEPHRSLNIGLAAYQHMMDQTSYCMSMGHVADVDTLSQVITATTRSLMLLNSDLEMEYFGCFMADMQWLNDMVYQIRANVPPFDEETVENLIRNLSHAASLARKRCINLLSSYKRFRVTDTLAYLHEFGISLHIPVDRIFDVGFTVVDVLSTLQQHRHIIQIFYKTYDPVREWVLDVVALNDGLFEEDALIDKEIYEGWRTRGEWRHKRILVMSQRLATMTLNPNHDNGVWDFIQAAADFFESRNLSDIRTAKYFEDPCNLSILASMAEIPAQAYLSAFLKDNREKLEGFIVSVLCWFNRQLTNSVTLSLLEGHDRNIIPKMRITMKQIFENHFLPNYRRSYYSELCVSTRYETNKRSIKLNVLPLPQGWSHENIPYVRYDGLSTYWCDFHGAVFPRNGEIPRGQNGTPTISHQHWHPYLASVLLNSMAKHLYQQVHPNFESRRRGEEQTPETFAYIVDCLPYAETTQPNLDSLRAIAYLFPNANLDWDPPIEFWYLCVEFLRKYDRSILSAEELNEFEWWMYSMGRWMKRYRPAAAQGKERKVTRAMLCTELTRFANGLNLHAQW